MLYKAKATYNKKTKIKMIDITSFVSQVIDPITEQYLKYENKQRLKNAVYGVAGTEKPKEKYIIPDYYSGYKLAVEWLCQVRAHSEKGYFPEWLFENNSPNQTEIEKQYTKANFRQTTIEVFKDYVDTMARAYHDGNYQIEWPVEDNQYQKPGLSAKEYFTEDLPEFGSIETYVFEYQAPLKIMDAMGVNVVLPGEIVTVEGEEGRLIVDPSSLLAPYPQFYHVNKVLKYTDEYYLILSEEKSTVKYNDRDVEEGIIYWLIDDRKWYQVRQVGKKVDYIFEIVPIFEHGLDYIPVIRAGGITIQIDSIVMEQSPFLFAVDTLDQVLIDSSLLTGSMANCCYPYRVMIGDPCENTMKVEGENIMCSGGSFYFHNGTSQTCNVCHGTGLKDRITPTGVMLIKPQVGTMAGDQIKPSDALYYASPDPATLEFTAKRIDYNITKSYNTLHIRRDNAQAQGSGQPVTATELVNENKALIASITTNSKQNFEILRFLVDTIGLIRYGDNFKKPTIKEPISYDFFTPEEYMKQVANSIATGQPSIMTQSVIRDALGRIYFKDTESKKKLELITRADRLMAMSEQDINLKRANRLVEPYEIILHDSILLFIDELVELNPKFWELSLKQQKDLLVTMAKEKVAFIQPVATTVVQTAQQKLERVLATV
jgi:hypothetical protein